MTDCFLRIQFSQIAVFCEKQNQLVNIHEYWCSLEVISLMMSYCCAIAVSHRQVARNWSMSISNSIRLNTPPNDKRSSIEDNEHFSLSEPVIPIGDNVCATAQQRDACAAYRSTQHQTDVLEHILWPWYAYRVCPAGRESYIGCVVPESPFRHSGKTMLRLLSTSF